MRGQFYTKVYDADGHGWIESHMSPTVFDAALEAACF